MSDTFTVTCDRWPNGNELYSVVVDPEGEAITVASGSTRDEAIDAMRQVIAEAHEAIEQLRIVEPQPPEREPHIVGRIYTHTGVIPINPPLSVEPGDWVAFNDNGRKLGRFRADGTFVEERDL